jgi:hypothetical protein
METIEKKVTPPIVATRMKNLPGIVFGEKSP